MIQNHYDQINFTERKHVFMYFNIAIKLHLMAWSDLFIFFILLTNYTF